MKDLTEIKKIFFGFVDFFNNYKFYFLNRVLPKHQKYTFLKVCTENEYISG